MPTQEIRYTGYTAVPSDYDAPDGQLAYAYNLINETGALTTIAPPKVLRSLDSYECLAIHEAGGYKWIIAYSASEGKVYASRFDSSAFILIASGFSRKPAVAILGNTITLSDGISTYYVLYKPDTQSYKKLGTSIPEVSLSFALSHKAQGDEKFTDTVTIGIPEGFSMDNINQIFTAFSQSNHPTTYFPGDDTEAFLHSVTTAILGFLNSMNAKTAEENKFIHPFQVRWAYRLYDGSYIHQSAPILMVPNSGMPPLKYTLSNSGKVLNIALETIVRRCTLMFRPTGVSALADWADIIKSIDIFVSAPVYIYDQSGNVTSSHRTGEAETIFSHSGAYSISASSSGSSGPSGSSGTSFSENNHRPPHQTSLSGSTIYTFPSGNVEQVATTGTPAIDPPRFRRTHIESGITSIANFYLVASIPVSGDGALSDLSGFTPVDMYDTSLSTLTSRPTLPDDWRSHDTLHFRNAFSYNSRLALSSLSSTLFTGFSLSDMGQYYAGASDSSANCFVFVKIVRDFRTYWVYRQCTIIGNHLPRFLFYPDPNAVEMRIIPMPSDGVITPSGDGWKLPLKAHDFLNGAYWFDGLSTSRTSKGPVSIPDYAPYYEGSSVTVPIADDKSKVFLSEVNNPYLFPLVNRITVGSSEIMGLSSSAKALSQGQFGQFPLYVFTDEGVWALEVSSTGTFSARQPITRDVCINPEAITQIDSAVLFPTSRGIMLLSGSQTQCLSDDINSDTPFWPYSLPGSSNFEDLLGPYAPSTMNVMAFSNFLKTCGIVYDYPHQRVIVFNPSAPYSYVLSLRTKLWGMMASNIKAAVRAYPYAYAADANSKLVDFTTDPPGYLPKGMLVTRPLKLGAPDLLKSILAVVQRGFCGKGVMSVILYGSRDLFNWQLIRSSDSGVLQFFSGTPFKYFRLVIVVSLVKGNSLSGCTVDYSIRFNNRLR